MAQPGKKEPRKTALPRQLYPVAVEREYRKVLAEVAAFVREAIRREVYPLIAAAIAEQKRLTQRLFRANFDAIQFDQAPTWSDEIDKAMESIKARAAILAQEKARDLRSLAEAVADVSRKKLNRLVKAAIGVDVFTAEPWLAAGLAAWEKENIALIKSIPEGELYKINGLAMRGVRSGAPAKDIIEQINKRFTFAVKNAKLIARDQISKLNADLTRQRQQDLGITKYIWRTVLDERVRPDRNSRKFTGSHRIMHGKLCRWDNADVYSDDDGKTWKQRSAIGGVELHPGRDYQCRCEGEPVVSEILEKLKAA